MRERGQVVPLFAGIIVFAGFVMIGVAHLAGGAVDRAAAKTAADAAALAGAADGEKAAGEYARRDGARLTEYDTDDRDAIVEVRYGDARAVSKARLDGGGKGAKSDAAPALQAALARAAQLLGHRVAVVRTSGYVVTLTDAAYAELAPRAVEAGLCPSGPRQMKVCGAR